MPPFCCISEKFFICLSDHFITQKTEEASYTRDLTFINKEKLLSELYRSYKNVKEKKEVILELDTGSGV